MAIFSDTQVCGDYHPIRAWVNGNKTFISIDDLQHTVTLCPEILRKAVAALDAFEAEAAASEVSE